MSAAALQFEKLRQLVAGKIDWLSVLRNCGIDPLSLNPISRLLHHASWHIDALMLFGILRNPRGPGWFLVLKS